MAACHLRFSAAWCRIEGQHHPQNFHSDGGLLQLHVQAAHCPVHLVPVRYKVIVSIRIVRMRMNHGSQPLLCCLQRFAGIDAAKTADQRGAEEGRIRIAVSSIRMEQRVHHNPGGISKRFCLRLMPNLATQFARSRSKRGPDVVSQAGMHQAAAASGRAAGTR